MVEHGPWRRAGVARDRLRELEVNPPANTPRRRNTACSSVVEQVVAPLERGAQRLVARQDDARAAGEQPEARVEAGRATGPSPSARHARCRELDRERSAVEPTADLDDEREVRRSSAKSRVGGAHAR